MEVPTKWSRASVISFIKGLGKRAGVCVHVHAMLASFEHSDFTQTGCRLWGLGACRALELVFTSHLSSEVGSHGQQRSDWPDRVVNSHTPGTSWKHSCELLLCFKKINSCTLCFYGYSESNLQICISFTSLLCTGFSLANTDETLLKMWVWTMLWLVIFTHDDWFYSCVVMVDVTQMICLSETEFLHVSIFRSCDRKSP